MEKDLIWQEENSFFIVVLVGSRAASQLSISISVLPFKLFKLSTLNLPLSQQFLFVQVIHKGFFVQTTNGDRPFRYYNVIFTNTIDSVHGDDERLVDPQEWRAGEHFFQLFEILQGHDLVRRSEDPGIIFHSFDIMDVLEFNLLQSIFRTD